MTFFPKLLLSGLLALYIGLPTPVGAAPSQYPQPYANLLEETAVMARQDTMLPMRILNLANSFAEAPDPELTATIVDKALTHSPSRYVRRVGYTALRFMERREYQSIDLAALIFRGLDDDNNWVRYDAIWLADEVNLDTPELRAKLAEIADGLDPADYDSIEPNDSRRQMQRRAGRLLEYLSGNR